MSLEETIHFHHELRAGEELDVSCTFVWGDGKTFRVEQELRRSDGTLAAEVANVGGRQAATRGCALRHGSERRPSRSQTPLHFDLDAVFGR